jgi:hypothetical protein
LHGVESLGIHRTRADRQQLTQHAAHCDVSLKSRTDAKGADALDGRVARPCQYALPRRYVHQMAGAKTETTHLLHPVDGGQQLARCVGGLPHGGRVQTVVAVLKV